MFFELTDEQRAIKRLARDFAEKRLATVQAEDEEKHLFRREVVSEMGELGLLGTVLPEEYGGSNVGFLSTALIIEELARVSASYSTYSMSQAVVFMPATSEPTSGSVEPKQTRISPLLRAGKYFSFCSPVPYLRIVNPGPTACDIEYVE